MEKLWNTPILGADIAELPQNTSEAVEASAASLNRVDVVKLRRKIG
jgi:hypothetical protein